MIDECFTRPAGKFIQVPRTGCSAASTTSVRMILCSREAMRGCIADPVKKTVRPLLHCVREHLLQTPGTDELDMYLPKVGIELDSQLQEKTLVV